MLNENLQYRLDLSVNQFGEDDKDRVWVSLRLNDNEILFSSWLEKKNLNLGIEIMSQAIARTIKKDILKHQNKFI